jgi:hypothetical protein
MKMRQIQSPDDAQKAYSPSTEARIPYWPDRIYM